MAIFRGGVKLGKGGMNDVRVSLLSKKRAKGLLRKAKILPEAGRKRFDIDARGEVTMYRKAVAQAEGFQFPVNFKVTFVCPLGISHPVYTGAEEKNPKPEHPDSPTKPKWSQADPNGFVRGGGLDWKTHKMNFSVRDQQGSIQSKFYEAAKVAATLWNPNQENMKTVGGHPDTGPERKERDGDKRQETLLNLFCSKVSIPEKSINMASMRHYGTHFPYPQSVSYGTLSTTFYLSLIHI